MIIVRFRVETGSSIGAAGAYDTSLIYNPGSIRRILTNKERSPSTLGLHSSTSQVPVFPVQLLDGLVQLCRIDEGVQIVQ